MLYRGIKKIRNVWGFWRQILPLVFHQLKVEVPIHRRFRRDQDGLVWAALQTPLGKLFIFLYFLLYPFRREIKLSPLTWRWADCSGKMRRLYRLSALDEILIKCLSVSLSKIFEKAYSANLYSYQKGKSSFACLKNLKQALQKEKSEVFILKADISQYDQDIVHERLLSGVDASNLPLHPQLFKVLRAFLRAEVREADGSRWSFCRGIAAGVSLTNVINNIYLLPLDRAVEASKPLFYGRYGDDFLVVVRTEEERDTLKTKISKIVSDLSLSIHESKWKSLRFSSETSCRFDFLGMSLNEEKHLGLPVRKQQQVQQLMRHWADNSKTRLAWSKNLNLEKRLIIYCNSLREELSVQIQSGGKVFLALKYADDPKLFRHLDLYAKQLILKGVVGGFNRKNFRSVEKLKKSIRFPSFEYFRHQLGKNERS